LFRLAPAIDSKDELAGQGGHRRRGKQAGAAVGMNCQTCLPGAQPAVGFLDGRGHLFGSDIAVDVQRKTAMVRVSLGAEARMPFTEHVNGSVFEAMIPANAADGGF